MSAADAPASTKARQRLVLRLQELGATEDEKQRHVCAVWTRGRARTRRELTEAEAGSLYARLREMTADDLARVLATPAPAVLAVDGCPVEEGTASSCPYPPGECCMTSPEARAVAEPEPKPAPELPAGVMACGPGTLTEHDTAKVAAFAAFLATAGPPPTREELAAVDPDPADPSTWSEVDWVADAEGTGPLSDVPHEEEPAPVPCEPPRRTPEEIEAAALAAVDRFRARAAAGIVPEPPHLLDLPPRIPVPYVAPGRYCLARCYCGGCPQHAAQVEAAERAYRQELTAARNKDLRG